MMRTIHIRGLLAAFAFAFSSSVQSQTTDNWSSFFTEIGGDQSVKVVGPDSVEARPMRDNAPEIISARYFKTKGTSDPFATTVRAMDAFVTNCSALKGKVLANDNPRTLAFADRVVARLTRPTGMRHQWRGQVAICDSSEGVPIAGLVSIIKDTSEIFRTGDVGSQAVGRLFGAAPNTTAIYLFRPDRLPTRAWQLEREAAETQNNAEEKKRIAAGLVKIEEFRRKLSIGDQTNCGPVINVRGPMFEIAVPVSQKAPNGQPTFWSRAERLFPRGYAICSYGL